MGPTPEGELPENGLEAVRKIADWLGRTKEAFYNTVPVSDAIKNRDIFATCRGNDLYIHFYKDPAGSSVELAPLEMVPDEAILRMMEEIFRFIAVRAQNCGQVQWNMFVFVDCLLIHIVTR